MQKYVGRTLYWAICLGCLLLILCGVVMPLVLMLLAKCDVYLGDWMSWARRVQLISMQLFFPAWVFFAGACFGSFLNVVAWRVPRGKSILGPSRCPNCDVQLKLSRDNMPILGWLQSGGRCASCQWAIPIRYFLLELVLGIAFAILFQLQTASGGMTLPFRELPLADRIVLNFPPDLLMVLGYHLTLLCLIFTFAVCAADKFIAPVKVLLVGVAMLAIWQCCPLSCGIVDFRFEVSSVEAASTEMISLLDTPRIFLITSGVGLIAATLCFLFLRSLRFESLHGAWASLFLVGAALGWQSLLSVVIISCVVHLVTRIQFTASLFCGTLLHLLTWRWQLDWPWWPGPNGGLWQVIAAVFSIALLATIIRFAKSSVPVVDQH